MPGAVTPTTVPAQGSGNLTPTQIGELWLQAGGPISQLPIAIAVALAESGGRVTAHNPSGASGLWQLMPFNQHGNPYNPQQNAKDAVKVFKGSGWGAWTTYTSGAYKKYYGQAVSVASSMETSGIAKAIESGTVIFGPFVGAAGLDAAAGASEGASAAEAGAAGGGAGGGAGALSKGLLSAGGSHLARDLGIAALAGALLDPKFMMRVFFVIGGLAALILGVWYMLRSSLK